MYKYILLLLMLSPIANAIGLIGENNTQFSGQSCQSYTFAILLTLKDSSYGDTAERLNTTEKEIRSLVEKYGGNSGSHNSWKKAITEYTGGAYELKTEYPAKFTDWVTRVRELTTPSLTDITKLEFEKAIATSVNSIDGSSYSSGHVITVIGVDDRVADNQILYLNGGIKPESDTDFSDHICRENSYGSDKYVVGIRQSNTFELKGNGIYWLK